MRDPGQARRSWKDARLHLAHHRIDQARGGNFFCLLDQFHRFIHSGVGGNFGEKLLLIDTYSQGGEDLKVELAERREAEIGDGGVQQRTPA